MSGHSKWSKVKHQKATTDSQKAAAFTKASRAISVSVKEGGGVTDPNFNFHLRLAIEQARSVNMPKENITRAVERGSGGEGSTLSSVHYEGFGPHGVSFFIEAMTDNTNRTVSFIKQTLDHHGGSMGSPGSVGYLFRRRGLITVPKNGMTFDKMTEVALESGAEDVRQTDEVYEIYTTPEVFAQAKTYLESKDIRLEFASLIMDSQIKIPLTEDQQKEIENLVTVLEEHDDIQHVYTNS